MKTKVLLSIVLTAILSISVIAQPVEKEHDSFKYKMEDNKLKVEKTYFSLGTIYNNQNKTVTSEIYNDSNTPMEITFSGVPDYITINVTPVSIPAKTKAHVTLEYKTSENKTNQGKQNWGYQNNRIQLIVNGNTQNTRNKLTIRANIQEDFKSMTAEQLKKGPMIEFENLTYNFGTVTQGDKIEHEFVFKNLGENDLEIRNVKSSCGCTAVNVTDEAIKKGKSSSIKAVFNTRGKKNRQNKTITINTNDPTHPTIVVKLTGEVTVPKKTADKSPAKPTHKTIAPKVHH